MRTLIVGLAKTGTSALLYTIAQASPHATVFFEPPASKLHNLPEHAIAKVLFESQDETVLEEAAQFFDRKIILLRDPRDAFISRVLFALNNKPELLANDDWVKRFVSQVEAKQLQPAEHDFLSLDALYPPEISLLAEAALNRGRRYLDFVARHQNEWEIIYYEDLIAGNLRGLKRYLGLPLQGNIELPTNLSHISRSKSSGQWRHWFTERDVEVLRPRCMEQLKAWGYDTDWTLADTPTIAQEQATNYVKNLIETRRRHYNLSPPGTSLKHNAPCNICDGNKFGPGPNGRMATTGIPPYCTQCEALERQRMVRNIFQTFPIGFIDWRKGLQFSPDPGVPADLFRSYEVSIYGGANSIDMQAIDRSDGSYDFISLNHVLEFIPDDLKSFEELTRILSPRGFIQACFSTPLSRPMSIDYEIPFGPHEAWHLYGLDFAERFQCEKKGLSMLIVEGFDPSTETREIIHFFAKDKRQIDDIKVYLNLSKTEIRIIS